MAGPTLKELKEQLDAYQITNHASMAELLDRHEQLNDKVTQLQLSFESLGMNLTNQLEAIRRQLSAISESTAPTSSAVDKGKGVFGSSPASELANLNSKEMIKPDQDLHDALWARFDENHPNWEPEYLKKLDLPPSDPLNKDQTPD